MTEWKPEEPSITLSKEALWAGALDCLCPDFPHLVLCSLCMFTSVSSASQQSTLSDNNDVREQGAGRGTDGKRFSCSSCLFLPELKVLLPASAGDTDSIPGSGRSPGRGNGNPLQCSCQENSTDRGAWWATVHGVTQNRTQLSTTQPITISERWCQRWGDPKGVWEQTLKQEAEQRAP